MSPSKEKTAKKHGRTGRVRRRRRAREATCKRQPVPDTSPEMIAFMRFLKARGFVNSTALQPVLYEGQGRGLRSKKCSFAAQSPVIMSLPPGCLLLPEEITKSNPALYKRAQSSEDEVLAHFLYCQRQALDRGEAPEWAPYIRTLPQTYDGLPAAALFAADPQGELYAHLPHHFVELLQEYQRKLGNVLRNVQKLLAPEPLDLELFKWAFNVLNTRSVAIRSEEDDYDDDGNDERRLSTMALVPFFDLINHSPFADAWLQVCQKQNVFQVITQQPVKRGTQIFIHYNGIETNREFFINYGFIHLPPVPERLLTNPDIANCFTFVPSPMDFFKLTLDELFRLPRKFLQAFPETPPCLKAAITRMSKRMAQVKKVMMGRHSLLKLLGLSWPCQLCMRHEQYVVSLKQDGSYDIFDRKDSSSCCSPLPEQSTYGRYITSLLDVLLCLLSVRHLPKEDDHNLLLSKRCAKMARKHKAKPNAEGPLGELPSAEERLLYYHLQLLITEWLLWRRFASDHHMPLKEDEEGDQVQRLQQYHASLPEMPGQLGQLFTREMALLLFTRRRLREKCHSLKERLQCDDTSGGGGGGGLLRCTCGD